MLSNLKSGKRLFRCLTEPVRRKPLISMGGKAHKVFGRAVTLPYAHLHLFLHRRGAAGETPARSCSETPLVHFWRAMQLKKDTTEPFSLRSGRLRKHC